MVTNNESYNQEGRRRMKWKNTTFKDCQIIVKKLDLQPTRAKRSKHPVYWYVLDGKQSVRVTMPNTHGGSGSLSTGFITSIRNNLRLSNREFEDLIDCPLTSEEFEELIRDRLDQ